MPGWKIHLIFSLFLVIALVSIFNFTNFRISVQNLVTLFIIITFSSMFPDVDIRRSKIRTLVSLIITVVLVGFYMLFYTNTWYYGPVYFVILYLILKYLPTKHRGITHTFKFSVVFSLVLSLVYFAFAPFSLTMLFFWFTIALLSYNIHLLIDKK